MLLKVIITIAMPYYDMLYDAHFLVTYRAQSLVKLANTLSDREVIAFEDKSL